MTLGLAILWSVLLCPVDIVQLEDLIPAVPLVVVARPLSNEQAVRPFLVTAVLRGDPRWVGRQLGVKEWRALDPDAVPAQRLYRRVSSTPIATDAPRILFLSLPEASPRGITEALLPAEPTTVRAEVARISDSRQRRLRPNELDGIDDVVVASVSGEATAWDGPSVPDTLCAPRRYRVREVLRGKPPRTIWLALRADLGCARRRGIFSITPVDGGALYEATRHFSLEDRGSVAYEIAYQANADRDIPQSQFEVIAADERPLLELLR